jgi:hypothetical protein
MSRTIRSWSTKAIDKEGNIYVERVPTGLLLHIQEIADVDREGWKHYRYETAIIIPDEAARDLVRWIEENL